MSQESLDNAIKEAATELAAETEKATGKNPLAQEETQEGTEEETQEETQEESSEASDELSESQIQESKNLYKALTGPNAAAIIAALAQQAGILPASNVRPITQKEETVARREVKQIVKDALGPEYAFLSDKIGKIFEEVVDQQNAETEARLQDVQRSTIEQKVVTATDKLAIATKGESKKFEARMGELSEEVPIGNMDIDTYVKRLFVLASGERKASPQKIADQIRKNANDTPNRLRSAATPQHTVTIPNKKMSLDESVQFAIDQIQKGKR